MSYEYGQTDEAYTELSKELERALEEPPQEAIKVRVIVIRER
jgi:hypothetical protein